MVSQIVSYFLRVASISSAELELLFPIPYEFVSPRVINRNLWSVRASWFWGERMIGIVATQVTTPQGKFV